MCGLEPPQKPQPLGVSVAPSPTVSSTLSLINSSGIAGDEGTADVAELASADPAATPSNGGARDTTASVNGGGDGGMEGGDKGNDNVTVARNEMSSDGVLAVGAGGVGGGGGGGEGEGAGGGMSSDEVSTVVAGGSGSRGGGREGEGEGGGSDGGGGSSSGGSGVEPMEEDQADASGSVDDQGDAIDMGDDGMGTSVGVEDCQLADKEGKNIEDDNEEDLEDDDCDDEDQEHEHEEEGEARAVTEEEFEGVSVEPCESANASRRRVHAFPPPP